MKTTNWLLLPAVLFVFAACELIEGDDPANGIDMGLVAEAVIGPEGGTLESDDFELEVPEGSFSDTYHLELWRHEPGQHFGENEATSFYTVSGLPISHSIPLTYRFTHNSSKSNGLFVAVGEEVFVSHLDDEHMEFRFDEGTIDPDMLSYEMPVVPLAPHDKTGGGTEEYDVGVGWVENLQVADSDPAETVARVYFWDHQMASAASDLAQYIAEAYSKIKSGDLGFSYEARSKWPVKVNFLDIGDAHGYYTNSQKGNNYGWISINTKIAHDETLLRATAGHEFFHLVQSFYDPRNAYSKAKNIPRSPWLWVDEASAVWIEERFVDDPNYIPSIRAGNELAPFDGMIVGAELGAQDHGYGMSALMKYIEKEFGTQTIRKIYEYQLEGEKDVLESFDHALPHAMDMFTQYGDFMEQYIRQELYADLMPAQLYQYAEDEFVIQSEEDFEKSFVWVYQGLSANTYQIRPEYDGLTEEHVMTITSEGADTYTWGTARKLLFVSDGADLVPVADDYDEIRLSNLNEYKDKNLLLVVVHYGYEHVPGIVDVNIDVELSGEISFNLGGTPYHYTNAAGAYVPPVTQINEASEEVHIAFIGNTPGFYDMMDSAIIYIALDDDDMMANQGFLNITVTEYGEVGGRIVGTFDGSLNPTSDNPTPITNGSFDVPRLL